MLRNLDPTAEKQQELFHFTEICANQTYFNQLQTVAGNVQESKQENWKQDPCQRKFQLKD